MPLAVDYVSRNKAALNPSPTKSSDFFYSKTKPDAQYLRFILFWNNTLLHVSDGLSAHHQESKTVHTASGICYSLRLLMMDGETV